MPETPTPDPTQAEYLQFGGMAVPEGVMMRSPNYWSVACRAPNGQIVVKTEPLEKTWIGRQNWLKKPFLRGSLAMLDTMALGTRAMNYASNVQMDPALQAEPLKVDDKAPSKARKVVDTAVIALTITVSLAVGYFIFNVIPQFLAEYGVRAASGDGMDKNTHLTLTNYVVEVVKLAMFIGYLAAIGQIPAIKEVFRYHGAEHKAITATEHRLDLTMDNCHRMTRLHPRCGTNFALVVLVVSFLLFPLIPRDLFVPATSPGWLIALTRLPVELALLPLVAGISYEVIRWAGRAKNQTMVKVLLAPGLATQLITTAEPADKHIEVAIESLRAVQQAESTGELTNTPAPEAPVGSAAAVGASEVH